MTVRAPTPVIFSGMLFLALWACARTSPSAREMTNADIIKLLNAREGSHACCFYAGNDRSGEAIYKPTNSERELHVIVKQHLNGEEVICGWSGFPPAKAFNGKSMSSGPDTVFIIRHDKLYTAGDLSATEFKRWQDRLCGSDWVTPLYVPGTP